MTHRSAVSGSRKAVILPVVLFVLLLVGLLSAMFSFRVNADLAAMRANAVRLQSRLAAEAGVERAKLLLMEQRNEMSAWYNNPEELHRVVVWATEGDSSTWGTPSEELDDSPHVYRYSLVADDPNDFEDFVRFGMTDESSRLNLNKATEDQLRKLVFGAVGDDPELDPEELVAAILDWRDADSDPRGSEGDTEGDYYAKLDKPYAVKNGPFTTVEELLLVKGITPEIFYGEDFDRNGLLTPNEDDGETSFPMDNEDGDLNQGLYPYLTVISYETDISADNRRRIYLKGDENAIRPQLDEIFPDEPGVVNFIVEFFAASGSGSPAGGDGAEQGEGDGEGNGVGSTENSGDEGSGIGSDTGSSDSDKSGPRSQRGPSGSEDESSKGDTTTGEGDSGGEPPAADGDTGASEGDGSAAGGSETADGGSGSSPISSPVSLLLPRSVGGELRTGPVGVEHLPMLLDRTTLHPPEEQERIEGLINVNTAPRQVLECIEGLTSEQVDRILQVRDTLSDESKLTFAWLASEEIVDLPTLEVIAPGLTARGQQFTLEVLGYGDHVGMVTRLQVVLDMLGPIPQVIYYRDLSYLGGSYPIREEDLERVRGF